MAEGVARFGVVVDIGQGEVGEGYAERVAGT